MVQCYVNTNIIRNKKDNIIKYDMTKHELEQEVKRLQVLIDILWEYISEKDLNEINKKLEEL